MKSEGVVGIKPEIFRWARESVGLTTTDVAELLKRNVDEIEAWEMGSSSPTYPQLEKLAYQIYKRPLAVFFLPAPPEEIPPKREFRTLPDMDMDTLERDTYIHIRRAHAYQFALKELFHGRNSSEKLIWNSISLMQEKSLAKQAKSVRDYLGISLEKQIAWKNDDHALKSWRKAIEDVGVFVFKAAIKQKDISGFCLIDEHFPVIYLNNSTTKTRQIFSLLHELAHLLFNVNGLSKFDTTYVSRLPKTEKQIEIFCNAFAAEMLIPTDDFELQIKHFQSNIEKTTEEQFSNLAERYGVSREAVLRRFLDKGRVSQSFYEAKAKFWANQKKPAGGGNWYLNQGAYISENFAKAVVSLHYRHQITLEKASDLLGIKPKSYAGFEARILHGAEA